MAERRPPRGEPPSGGFFRIPEPGGGGGGFRTRMTPKLQSRLQRSVYKEARKEVKKINKETRANRTKIQRMSSSDYWGNQRQRTELDGFRISPGLLSAQNVRKGKMPSRELMTEGALHIDRGRNPFKSMFKMKMDAASKGLTKGGKLIGHNDNQPGKKK